MARHTPRPGKTEAMAALTSLMTRFCAAKIVGWPVAAPATQAHSKSGMAMENHDAMKASVETMKTAQTTRR